MVSPEPLPGTKSASKEATVPQTKTPQPGADQEETSTAAQVETASAPRKLTTREWILEVERQPQPLECPYVSIPSPKIEQPSGATPSRKRHVDSDDSDHDSEDLHVPKRARLTRRNLKLLNKMVKSKRDCELPSENSGDTGSSSISITSRRFEVRAAGNGIHKPLSRPHNTPALLTQPHQTASPPDSMYECHAYTVGCVPDEEIMLGELAQLLTDYAGSGYRRVFKQAFTAYPMDVGFNDGLPVPKPCFVQGLCQEEFLPFPIADELDSAVVFDGKDFAMALPHIAGEWNRNMEEAILHISYTGAALVHSRNEALAYMGKPDPPGHAHITTFATDGTTLTFFAHYTKEWEGILRYHMWPVSTINLTSSYESFKEGVKQLRNAQDYAREQSYHLMGDLKKHWMNIHNAGVNEASPRPLSPKEQGQTEYSKSFSDSR